jgi:uncharacterized protein (UPF0548 family)
MMLALVGFVAVAALAALLVLNLQGGKQRYADSLMTVCGRMSDDVGIRDRSVELGMSGALKWPSSGAKDAYKEWAAQQAAVQLDDTASNALAKLEASLARSYSLEVHLAYVDDCYAAQSEIERLVKAQP